ncbi:hypothetical protein K493DRAFT_411760 [Basidiobolus meristosporus CBS 931.73]|uniref:Transcription factor domain-containing protein n=1 Tax=Basidiobolus meristosporus CBS 931.73 TaxID=1314790 RepID=A0A1Y1XAN1_9FUNG|nr:hypothetical protein K493DRAFT_411760 [Basidiobolus meristosporus CBS 931.73]|eukprot:ORX82789.1 hypothetical protein K493DRAFT_411760 [Basidiobolus meristosporus CBS 931.73]
MLFYDGRESAASTCLMLGAKIVQESGLALQDIDHDALGSSPIDGIEKEERRRLFWWLLILDRWAQKRTMTVEEKTACILPPGDEAKWQQLSFLLPSAQYRLSYEDRKMWSFMIEMEFLLSDISNLMSSLSDRNKLPALFGIIRITDRILDAPLKLKQLQSALHSWSDRLPSEYRYNAALAENVHASTHLDIPKWMRISYLISKLHLHQIQATLFCDAGDMGMVRECLEDAAEFVSIVRYLPETELVDDPLTFSYNILTSRILLTIMEYTFRTNENDSDFTQHMATLRNVEKYQMALQAKQHIDSIYELLSDSLVEIKTTAEHICAEIESQCMIPSSTLSESDTSISFQEIMETPLPPDMDIFKGSEPSDEIQELSNLLLLREC